MTKIIKSLAIIVAVIAIVGGGTYAWGLQKEEVKGIEIEAGSADLKIDDNSLGSEYHFVDGFTVSSGAIIEGVKPGSGDDQIFDIKNVGDSAGKTSIRFELTSNKENTRLTPEIEDNDDTIDGITDGGELANNIKFAVSYKKGTETNWVQKVGYYTLAEYNANSAMLPLGDIDPGIDDDTSEAGIANVKIDWMIPSDAGNEIMTDSVTFKIIFGLE